MAWVHATYLAMNAFTFLELDFPGCGDRSTVKPSKD
jgi:hypothetical protein